MPLQPNKPNGHDTNAVNGKREAPHPLDGVISDTPVDGAILQLQSGLFELGRKRALLSGTAKLLEEDVKSLDDHARATARETHRDRYDPSVHRHDKMRQDDYDNHMQQRGEAQKAEAHARANLRDADSVLAKTPKAGEKPAPNPWLVAAFTVAITITIAPTLHDFIFHTLEDDLLAWCASAASAACVAAMLTLAILTGRRTAWRFIGLIGGISVGLGLAAIRLSSAASAGECMFAIGLTIIEVAAVLLLESLASGLRHAEDQWIGVKRVEDEAICVRDAAATDLVRWQARLDEINSAIRNTIAYVEDRANRNLHLPELEEVAVKAVLDGYNAGITENVGHLRGVTRRMA